MKKAKPNESGALSRRTFFRNLGTVAATAATAQVQSVAAELERVNAENIMGPGAVPVALKVNGNKLNLMLEPRVTLLDALRNYSSLTGAKEGCDRASCGACTVLMDDLPIYSCQMLAIEAQGHEITTVEGLAQDGKLSPVQQAFIDHDALQCGYCTPGFIMSIGALLKRNPKPTAAEAIHACSGNLCRCGAQPHILQAVFQASGAKITTKTEVING